MSWFHMKLKTIIRQRLPDIHPDFTMYGNYTSIITKISFSRCFKQVKMIRPVFLLVDLRDFFSDLECGDKKKSSENDQLTGHFQRFF